MKILILIAANTLLIVLTLSALKADSEIINAQASAIRDLQKQLDDAQKITLDKFCNERAALETLCYQRGM